MAAGKAQSAASSKRSAALESGAALEDDLGLDLSNDIKGILNALQLVRKKARTDGQKRNEEIINSVKAEVKALVEESKSKSEKERQNFVKGATKMWKDCEACLKAEADKYRTIYEKFCKDRDLHQQAYEDAFSKFEEAKEALLARYDQQRKKEKAMLADLQKTCSEKIMAAEEQLKKKKQEDKSFSMLRKSLGSFLEDDEE